MVADSWIPFGLNQALEEHRGSKNIFHEDFSEHQPGCRDLIFFFMQKNLYFILGGHCMGISTYEEGVNGGQLPPWKWGAVVEEVFWGCLEDSHYTTQNDSGRISKKSERKIDLFYVDILRENYVGKDFLQLGIPELRPKVL